MATTINRDPFARADLVRRLVPKDERRSCDWCGSRPGRFRYVWEGDGRPTGIDRLQRAAKGFCSADCARDYEAI